MNGHIKGTVESGSGTIVIGEGAVIHADVFVKYATVSGEVRGTIRATELIKLHSSARVEGAVNAPRMQIDPGAIIDGRCTTGSMPESSRPADAAPAKERPKEQAESQEPAASVQ
jgi:cytoskeletal protein CcmA (bactofilin family)